MPNTRSEGSKFAILIIILIIRSLLKTQDYVDHYQINNHV